MGAGHRENMRDLGDTVLRAPATTPLRRCKRCSHGARHLPNIAETDVWRRLRCGTDQFEMDSICHDGMDENWLAEWIAFGFRELEAYLRRQAAFDAYYRRRRPAQHAAAER
jgi:hypothetical protein